ncbi:hypothetical protein ACQ4PT_023738 [Festuca glaucescens]
MGIASDLRRRSSARKPEDLDEWGGKGEAGKVVEGRRLGGEAPPSPPPQPPLAPRTWAGSWAAPMEDVRATYTFGRELGRGPVRGHLPRHPQVLRRQGAPASPSPPASSRTPPTPRTCAARCRSCTTSRATAASSSCTAPTRTATPSTSSWSSARAGSSSTASSPGGTTPERAAAALCREVVNVVHSCHSMGVMHRDLKPENFLFLNKREDSPLKATDFGLSVFFKPGEQFKDLVGSAYYVAPEVLKRRYGAEADIWSAGVILYILLSGVPPFWAENEDGIFDAVLKGYIDFSSEPWPSISNAAKDLVKRMLRQDPRGAAYRCGNFEPSMD